MLALPGAWWQDGADSHDPLLSNGRKKLPLLAPSCLFCADWRAAIANEGGTFMKVIYTCILLNCFALAIDQVRTKTGWTGVLDVQGQ